MQWIRNKNYPHTGRKLWKCCNGIFWKLIILVLSTECQNQITPHYRSEIRRQGSCGVFLGDLLYYLRTFLMCIIKIMSFVTDDWTNFIVFVLPEEVKVCTLFNEKAS